MLPSSGTSDGDGDSMIPASQRPDGSWRKARRVKQGYVPQEEVPLYESKGKQFFERSDKKMVTLASGQKVQQAIPGLIITVDEKAKAKRKAKKDVEEVTSKLETIQLKPNSPAKNKTATAPVQVVNAVVDTDKQLKKLKKRLREIEVLEEKLQSGAIAKPEAEQLAKVEKKNTLLYEIAKLEKL